MSEETIVFTLIYFLISICIIYPPTEFVTAGFTIPAVCSKFIGSEQNSFVMYHVRRMILTLLVYSLLPLGYILSLLLCGYLEITALFSASLFWKIFMTTSVVLPVTALSVIAKWCNNNYENHPIPLALTKFCNNNTNWKSVATNIDIEFRRVDKVVINSNPVTKIIVTENWIIEACPLSFFVCHQSDATLSVKKADTYVYSEELSETEYLNIEVKSSRPNVDSFIIRINSRDFRDLENRLARNIAILPNVKFHKTVVEKFVDVFKATVADNPTYDADQVLDPCIGCLQVPPNIKIQKMCEDHQGDSNKCTTCYCRPMWCVECMAKWFASRQDPEQKETWLKSKCTCPMCRATFCLLDVCHLSSEDIENVGNEE